MKAEHSTFPAGTVNQCAPLCHGKKKAPKINIITLKSTQHCHRETKKQKKQLANDLWPNALNIIRLYRIRGSNGSPVCPSIPSTTHFAFFSLSLYISVREPKGVAQLIDRHENCVANNSED